MKTALPLMDEVHKWTFSKKYPFGRTPRTPLSPASQSIVRTYRSKLRESEKFLIDDETVKLISQITSDPNQVKGYSVLARLPYSPMWLEYNQHVKVQALYDLGRIPELPGFEDISPTIGFLIFYDNHATRWIAHSFINLPDQTVIPSVLTYIFDPDGNQFSTPQGSSYWRTPTLSQRPNSDIKIPIVSKDGKTYGSLDPELILSGDLNQSPNGHFTVGSWFENRGAAIIDPFWTSWIPRRVTDSVIAQEVIENAGIVRWLVTLLGALNALPQTLRPALTRPGKRPVGLNLLPYFQHKTITINLPRTNRITWSRKLLNTQLKNMPRPWHRVLGHWRVIERGKSTHLCRHLPVMQEENLAMCQKCQLLVRWISDFHRGDPSIGTVSHTYKTKSPRSGAKRQTQIQNLTITEE